MVLMVWMVYQVNGLAGSVPELYNANILKCAEKPLFKVSREQQQVKYLGGFFIFHEIGKYGAEVIGFVGFSKIF